MIVIGYTGIGKSTLAKNNIKYIDLDHTSFYINGRRDQNWYIAYCQVAELLSKQGYCVFVCMHEPVYKYLANSSEKVIAVCPDPNLLKGEWYSRLYDAWVNWGDFTEDEIPKVLHDAMDSWVEMVSATIPKLYKDTRYITSMDYNLEEIINY